MDACFSGATLAIVGTVLTALTSAIGVLFTRLLASKDEQIRTLQDERRAFHEGWIKTLSANRTVAAVATQAMEIAERRTNE